jgi:hypothetical protein
VEGLAPSTVFCFLLAVYNRSIQDAQAYFQDRALELDGACHQDEFGYWTGRERREAAGGSRAMTDPFRRRRRSAAPA